MQCWCCYTLPHVPLWFTYLSVWQKYNRNCVIYINGHNSSLLCDGINQYETTSVNCLKKIIFIVVINILSVFTKAMVAALSMSQYKERMWNLCNTGFLYSFGWSHLMLTHRYDCYSALVFARVPIVMALLTPVFLMIGGDWSLYVKVAR